ncbi:MAG: bifunctional adenosylcobinamide kinase/adenosylcobinamide-phosphate guanylyltransferase [Brotaphodocola sp.]
MKLIIGGYAQGKLHYVLKKEAGTTMSVYDRELPAEIAGQDVVVIDHLHLWIRKRLMEGVEPENEIFDFVEQNPDCILISDEIGNGIVPIDSFEREYREKTGRILVKLAQKAEQVERIFCGISQKIKG